MVELGSSRPESLRRYVFWRGHEGAPVVCQSGLVRGVGIGRFRGCLVEPWSWKCVGKRPEGGAGAKKAGSKETPLERGVGMPEVAVFQTVALVDRDSRIPRLRMSRNMGE